MLILLAESKTMASQQNNVDPQEYETNMPALESTADEIMDYLQSITPAEISTKLGISHQLAVKVHDFAYDFPHKLSGYKAIYAFIGEAFKALDVNSISKNSLVNINERLRLISSVYGILKPYDIIKPYRCEFNKPITADSKTAIQIFRSKVTIEFVRYIKDNKISEVINLLPGDADKCLDWKIIRAFTSMHKICFQVMTPEGKLKTPIAKRLKELRGLMAREILENGFESLQQLKTFESDHYIYSSADSKPGLLVFISSE